MKKLNKKGFTLVELLAVIVILAIIMVITIPTVLGSMGTAKASAFESAVATIEEYAEKQYQICAAGLTSMTGNFDADLFNADCTLRNSGTNANSTFYTDLVENAGYETSDLTISNITLTNGVVRVYAVAGSGEFSGVAALNNIK